MPPVAAPQPSAAPAHRAASASELAFDQVRVHADPAASVGASAFTTGSAPQVAPAQQAPGKELLAHEAAHVVQPGAGPKAQE